MKKWQKPLAYVGAFLYFFGWAFRYFPPTTKTKFLVGGICVAAGLLMLAIYVFGIIREAFTKRENEKK